MERIEFVEAIDMMLKAFSPARPQDKAEVLFHFFKSEDLQTLSDAAENAARKHQKWPSPAEFGEFVREARGKFGKQKTSDCSFCDSLGYVIAKHKELGTNHAFRCHCPNGARLSAYTPWTHSKREDYTLYSKDLDVWRHSAMYVKGVAKLKEMGIKLPEGVEDKITKKTEADTPF